MVKAELRDETVRNGVVELHLFLVESGIKKRVHKERVIRQWPVEGDDDEVLVIPEMMPLLRRERNCSPRSGPSALHPRWFGPSSTTQIEPSVAV